MLGDSQENYFEHTQVQKHVVPRATRSGVHFTYDSRGNLTFDGVQSYEWDGGNRLINRTHAPVQTGEAQHQGLRERVVLLNELAFLHDNTCSSTA